MASRRRGPAAGDPKVAVAYLRVSTDEQHLGPEAQREQIERWAAGRGVRVAAWHVEHVSGAAPLAKRRALEAAVGELGPLGAGLFVVAKRDRLARDMVAAAMIEALVRRAGAQVESADGVGSGDDPGAQLMRGIVDLFAQYERALIRYRTSAALAVKKGRGERVGTVPFGFRDRGDGLLETDDRERSVIVHALTLSARGFGVAAIVRSLREQQYVGRTNRYLSATQVRRILDAHATKPKEASQK
jgi:DNA invertase Pin-like site-specific DNA recombinase